MFGSRRCIEDGIESCSCNERCFGLRGQMPGMFASEMELTLEIGEGHIDIAHGHFRIGVPK